MDNLMYYLNEIKLYLSYIYLALSLILILLLIILLVKLAKLTQTKNTLLHKVDMTKAMIDVTTTKKTILSNDLKTKYHDFMRIFSIIAVIKYFKSRDNRQKDKEFKAYAKQQKRLKSLIES